MADKEMNFANEVTEFLRISCPRRETWRPDLTQYLGEFSYEAHHPVSGQKCKRFPINTGSSAEFYIEPILSCIGDTDVMYHYSNELAVPRGHLPPEQLPADFDMRVEVYEIVDTHLPGYVYLAMMYILSKGSDDEQYTVECVKQTNTFLNHDLYIVSATDLQECAEIHGPARKYKCKDFFIFRPLHTDSVPCIRCLKWPLQANDWPSRQRNYGWPNAASIAAVISNGCDVVGVAHPLCKHDEWMGKHQWRLSFSRAEVILLHSWTLEQQILYHMLRTFVKTERLTGGSNKFGADSFSNYHIKTSMLWACETTPQKWWTEGSNVVSTCVKLMHFINEWLSKWRGQHFFVSDVHFSDYLDALDIDTLCAIMKSTTVDSLAQWFVDSYIRKCAKRCPEIISLSCCDVVTKKILQDTITTIPKWREYMICKTAVEQIMSQYVSLSHLTGNSPDTRLKNFVNIGHCRKRINKELQSWISRNFSNVEFSIVYYLNNLFDIFGEYSFKNELVALFSLYAAKRWCSADERRTIMQCGLNSSSSVSTLTIAVTFMKFGAEKKRNTSELSLIELAKTYLHKALRCKDSDSDTIYCLANVYLAILYYTTGQCQNAIDHCTLVTNSQDHSRCSSQVQGKHLPKTGDEIDHALGLAVFYQYVRTAALNQRQTEHVNVFSTELFAHYFVTKRLLVTKFRLSSASVANIIPQTLCEHLKMFRNQLLGCENLLVSDLLLCKLPDNSEQLFHLSKRNIFRQTRPEVIKLLTQFSVERAMNLIPLLRPDTLDRSVAGMSSIKDFLPLYLYRCRLYDRCLELCQRNVNELINANVCRMSLLSARYNEFIDLMDNDIASLMGMAALVDEAGAQTNSAGHITVSQLTLSLYLFTQSQIKRYTSKTTTRRREYVRASLADISEWIAVSENIIVSMPYFDQLLLKLTERKALQSITTDKLGGRETFNTFCDALSAGLKELFIKHTLCQCQRLH